MKWLLDHYQLQNPKLPQSSPIKVVGGSPVLTRKRVKSSHPLMPESRFQQLMESPSLARSLSFPGHKAKVVGVRTLGGCSPENNIKLDQIWICSLDLLEGKNSPEKEVALEND